MLRNFWLGVAGMATSFAISGLTQIIIPELPTNFPARHYAPPRQVAAVTNILLTWDKYTNIEFVVIGSRDLTNWYFVTNVFCGETGVTVRATLPQEFFKIYTTNRP